MVQLLTDRIFCLHGILLDILSDRGPQVWKEICSAIGMKVSLSSGFRPQTNGQAEQNNQELESALHASSPPITAWTMQLAWVEFTHNCMTSSATGLFPFEASLGHQSPLFPGIEGEHSAPSV